MNSRALSKSLLVWVLIASAIWDGLLALPLLARPGLAAPLFHLPGDLATAPLGPEVLFLARVLGGFMLLLAVLCVLCLRELREGSRAGGRLALILGVFWLAIGLGLYAHPGSPPMVLTDTARGIVIVALAIGLRSERKPFSRRRS